MGFLAHLSGICFLWATRYWEMAIGVLFVQFGQGNSAAIPQEATLQLLSPKAPLWIETGGKMINGNMNKEGKSAINMNAKLDPGLFIYGWSPKLFMLGWSAIPKTLDIRGKPKHI